MAFSAEIGHHRLPVEDLLHAGIRPNVAIPGPCLWQRSVDPGRLCAALRSA